MAFSFFKKNQSGAQQKAKLDYMKACSLTGDSRLDRAFKARIGNRSKNHFDLTFIEAAKKTLSHHSLVQRAVSEGKKPPPPPKPRLFQKTKSLNGLIYTYLPIEYTEEIFQLGCMYQNMRVDGYSALDRAQKLAEKISLDIGLHEPFRALDFLRDELFGTSEDDELTNEAPPITADKEE
jgi:hypothetical protein